MTTKNVINKNLIIIAGPTAVGKTALCIELAKRLNSEIFSADSRQFYKEMSIGTAKPDRSELSEVKHHFINNLSIHDYYNVSMFEHDVLKKLTINFTTKNNVFLVGGSGLYIDSVCNGIDNLPTIDITVRERVKSIHNNGGLNELNKLLEEYDPEFHKIVDKSNPKRIMRALEVCFQTNKTYTSLRNNKSKKRNFNIIKIGLVIPREELHNRINHRVDIMINSGLIDEARKLYPKRDLNALNTVGYRELFDYFDDKICLDEAVAKIKTNTRRYARRQLTWFNKDNTYKWFNPNDYDRIEEYILGELINKK